MAILGLRVFASIACPARQRQQSVRANQDRLLPAALIGDRFATER
jgi:hypothetical protein